MIELLEDRIAPASLNAAGTVLTYTDYDGDAVKIVFTHARMFAHDFTFSNGGVDSSTDVPQFLSAISMTGRSGGSFTLTATPKNGLGDGHANIGSITSTGTDLGSISIDGDLALGTFTGSTLSTEALKSLTVLSLGGDVSTDNAVLEFQGLGSLTVRGDVSNVKVQLDKSPIKTSEISIGGDLVGGIYTSSAEIFSQATITSLAIRGSVIGGTGYGSGQVLMDNAGIHTLTIGESIIGGENEGNGNVMAGLGDPTATIKIGGDVIGRYAYSGQLKFGQEKSVSIGGSVVGSTQFRTGYIQGSASVGTLEIGSVIGGDSGDNNRSVTMSGYVEIDGSVTTLKIIHGIYAGGTDPMGSGTFMDGAVSIAGTLGAGTIGTIQGNVTNAAYLLVGGTGGGSQAIKSLVIQHSVVHGSIVAGFSSKTSPATNIDAGIGSVTIGGNFTASYLYAGQSAGTDNLAGTSDDALSSNTATIGSVKITGEFNGVSGSQTAYNIHASIIDKFQVGSVVYSHTAVMAGVSFESIGDANAKCAF